MIEELSQKLLGNDGVIGEEDKRTFQDLKAQYDANEKMFDSENPYMLYDGERIGQVAYQRANTNSEDVPGGCFFCRKEWNKELDTSPA